MVAGMGLQPPLEEFIRARLGERGLSAEQHAGLLSWAPSGALRLHRWLGMAEGQRETLGLLRLDFSNDTTPIPWELRLQVDESERRVTAGEVALPASAVAFLPACRHGAIPEARRRHR